MVVPIDWAQTLARGVSSETPGYRVDMLLALHEQLDFESESDILAGLGRCQRGVHADVPGLGIPGVRLKTLGTPKWSS